MGEYVNLANATARGANLVESFPHGFTMYLASTNLLLGQAHTVGGLPALGIMLVLGTISFVKALGLRAGRRVRRGRDHGRAPGDRVVLDLPGFGVVVRDAA